MDNRDYDNNIAENEIRCVCHHLPSEHTNGEDCTKCECHWYIAAYKLHQSNPEFLSNRKGDGSIGIIRTLQENSRTNFE